MEIELISSSRTCACGSPLDYKIKPSFGHPTPGYPLHCVQKTGEWHCPACTSYRTDYGWFGRHIGTYEPTLKGRTSPLHSPANKPNNDYANYHLMPQSHQDEIRWGRFPI